MSAIRITRGFDESERTQIASLYWEAFSQKLSTGLGPAEKALPFLARVADPEYALCARDAGGVLLGVAGYKTRDGAMVDGTFSDLAAVYGWLGATWRASLLSVLERKLESGIFLMDGIFVVKSERGKGIGTQLLSAIKERAAQLGYREVRLDVVDTNPRAMRLYERQGFEPIQTQETGLFQNVFGFSSATEMRFTLQPHS